MPAVFTATAESPRELWIELTSKCPFDCVFCSRKTLRGAGEHMPYTMFESLLGQLSDPRTIRLNYSGESTVYPDLLPAIRGARATGAFVELVTALGAAPDGLLSGLIESGLNRCTVSVHAARPKAYADIYRYGTSERFYERMFRLAELFRAAPEAPILDFAFAAMDRNLEELGGVAALAKSLGVTEIAVFPVIRRDEIPEVFTSELMSGTHRPAFQERVRNAVSSARAEFPDVAIQIANPAFEDGGACLGETPVPFPGPLPAGAQIHSCSQNPWETTHILSNGDVVACEVLDKISLGNVGTAPLASIWNGEPYRKFRERYRAGEVAECRACPWKTAFRPAPLRSEIVASRGRSAQLLYGWHEPSRGEAHIWSSQQAAAVLAPRMNSRMLHVCGMLPPGSEAEPNSLTVRCNGLEVGQVSNPWHETIPFGMDFPIAKCGHAPWFIDFRTRQVYRPSERGTGTDLRDLGFGLLALESKRFVDRSAAGRTRARLTPLLHALRAADTLAGCFARRSLEGSWNWNPGVSVLIPERDNVRELAACLAAVRRAAENWSEPIEVIVIVNGAPAEKYRSLCAEYGELTWQFHREPLGFSGAIAAGLRAARFDWVYLLNSDAILEPDALTAVAQCRNARVFGIASQIVFKDPTRFREETNWTALLLEDGLATIHDRIPASRDTVDNFYAGGAASLFQARLLRRFVQPAVYDPFYWEDVEWGWRARKLGYRSLFCASSVARHTQRSTISQFYDAQEIEDVTQRNRLLFQLRNFTRVGSLSRVLDEIAESPALMREYLLRPKVLWDIVGARAWNSTAPLSDVEVLAAGAR